MNILSISSKVRTTRLILVQLMKKVLHPKRGKKIEKEKKVFCVTPHTLSKAKGCIKRLVSP